jgi:hypothetical protein
MGRKVGHGDLLVSSRVSTLQPVPYGIWAVAWTRRATSSEPRAPGEACAGHAERRSERRLAAGARGLAGFGARGQIHFQKQPSFCRDPNIYVLPPIFYK